MAFKTLKDSYSLLPRRQTRVALLVIQATPFCNIDCRYCYLANRSSKGTVGDDTLDALFRKLFASGWVGRRLDIAWHAGEPTVLPVAFYRRAMAIAERHKPRAIAIAHNFQTNATLLDDSWIEFLRDPSVRVGVSIDGPQRINDINRLSRAGASTFARATAGIAKLREAGIPFHVITVLGPESLRSARELHDFYVEHGIEHVGFNVEESEGDHVSGLRNGAEGFAAFLAEFWAIAARDGRVRSIREIDHMRNTVFRNPPRSLRGTADASRSNMLTEPFAVLSVDHRGNLATYSPELLGQSNAEYNDFIVGNVHADEFADLWRSPVLARMDADIQAGIAQCRAQCPYFDLCGGGEPVNKLAENGTFNSAATEYCRMTRMAIADLMIAGPHGA